MVTNIYIIQEFETAQKRLQRHYSQVYSRLVQAERVGDYELAKILREDLGDIWREIYKDVVYDFSIEERADSMFHYMRINPIKLANTYSYDGVVKGENLTKLIEYIGKQVVSEPHAIIAPDEKEQNDIYEQLLQRRDKLIALLIKARENNQEVGIEIG